MLPSGSAEAGQLCKLYSNVEFFPQWMCLLGSTEMYSRFRLISVKLGRDVLCGDQGQSYTLYLLFTCLESDLGYHFNTENFHFRHFFFQ